MRSENFVDRPLVTLVGPPNSGKTTLFNLLSGKYAKTVNYPGSTVEYSTSKFLNKYNIKADILDSPGIISLLPNSPDEKVSVDSLYFHPNLGSPHLVVATIDSSQLSRHLLLAVQLIESGFNVLVVLMMNDILSKKRLEVDKKLLSEHLNCQVVKVNGRSGEGLESLSTAIKKNLHQILDNENSLPKPNRLDPNKSKLLETYSKIQKISDSVVSEIKQPENIDLVEANKQLEKLSNPYIINSNCPDTTTMKIDRLLLHKYWGIFIFILIMGITFSSIFWLAEPLMKIVDNIFSFLATSVLNASGRGWLSSLIADGLISGVGSVLVFVPQIIILFFILGVLEDTGYLARGAMLIDKPLSKIGLNGKSFVPMLSGFACAIPAMLAARTIPNRRERLLTIFILPLLSCSARLPVYALLLAYLIPSNEAWIGGFLLAGIYLFSTTSSVIAAGVINKFRKNIIKEEDNSSFILELPTYKMPTTKTLFRNTYLNSKQYLFRAGPIILIFSLIIWCLTYFPGNGTLESSGKYNNTETTQIHRSNHLENSYAAKIGKFIEPVMTPLGVDWRVGVSLISAFAAREVFVSSLAMIFKITDTNENLQSSLLSSMSSAKNERTGKKLFTISTIIGMIVFFVFALQCISTIAVSKKETGGWRIPVLQFIIFTSLAYIMTFLTVNGLRAIGVN